MTTRLGPVLVEALSRNPRPAQRSKIDGYEYRGSTVGWWAACTTGP